MSKTVNENSTTKITLTNCHENKFKTNKNNSVSEQLFCLASPTCNSKRLKTGSSGPK